MGAPVGPAATPTVVALDPLKTPPRNVKIYEIMVTSPANGSRTRMTVTKETTVEEVRAKARKIFGFDLDFLPEQDFKMYLRDDESKTISGPLGDHGLMEWCPEGTELHMYFEPSVILSPFLLAPGSRGRFL